MNACEASRGRSRGSTTSAKRTRTTVSVPVTATTETTSQTTTTSPARALVERVGNQAGEDSRPVHMRRMAALMAECEDTITSDAIAQTRRIHLEKLTNVKDAVVNVVPRIDAKPRLKMMLVEAALEGHVAAIGDCSGAFFTSHFWIQTEQKGKFGSSRLQRQSWDQTT